MLQVTLGPLLGGWREVTSDHRGRAVIVEPMADDDDMSASFSTSSLPLEARGGSLTSQPSFAQRAASNASFKRRGPQASFVQRGGRSSFVQRDAGAANHRETVSRLDALDEHCASTTERCVSSPRARTAPPAARV